MNSYLVKACFLGLLLFFISCAGNRLVIVESEFLVEQAPFLQCHASTIAEMNGEILVAYFGGTHERNPDVSIYLQRRVKGLWTKPRKVADGFVNDSLRYPTWNPVLFYRDNILFLYYKMGPSPVEWWGMYKTSFDNGESWSDPVKLPDDILGPIKNKPIILESGTILSPSSMEFADGKWKAHIERSVDGGINWLKINIPSSDSVKVIQPTLLEFPDNRILALLRSDQNSVMQSWSNDDGITWSKVVSSDLINPNSGIDAVATSKGQYLLVNNSMESGNSWEIGRNKLYLYLSTDGKSWIQILKLEDQEEGEFSYPSIIESEDHTIHICYTYNRKSIKYVKISM